MCLGFTHAQAEQIRIVAFGDSGVYGSGRSSSTGINGGVSPSRAFPALIQRNLRARGWDVEVANKGVPGDLASRALSRVDRDVPAGTHLTLVFIGGNDRRDGATREAIVVNQRKIIAAIREKGSKVLLIRGTPPAQPNPIVVLWTEGLWDTQTGYPNDPYDSGDREHLNAKGNELIAERAVPDIERVLGNMGFQPK